MAATAYPPSMWNDDEINSLTEIHKPFQNHKHMEALIEDIRNMFQSMENGKLNPSAYDTAWIARIASIDNPSQPQFSQTLNWIVCNQLSDGSWGGESFYIKGIDFEANALGLGISNELPFIKRILAIREAQLKEVDMGILYNLPTSLLLSLEGLQEVINWRKVLNFYSKDGYMLGSLASTACLYCHNLWRLRTCVYPSDLHERLLAVDTVERLGIGRYFKEEIKHALDYILD
ncbi:hypothetical protein SUGI_0680340 [Cryptomeria japonica]|nr:hypothetical protein SUGI_0680340 [Cryptomeria japonica]